MSADDALADVEDIYALSPLQLGMLFQTRLAPAAGLFYQQVAAPLPGGIDEVSFRRAWQAVVDRTPALRTSFHWAELEHPVQVVHRHVGVDVGHLDWRRLPRRSVAARLHAHMAQRRAAGFDLETCPLMRVELVSLPGGERWFLWQFHHLLLDGWSSQLVLKEFVDEYTASVQGRRHSPVARPPFSTYIAWLQRQDEATAERYWRSVIAGFDTPTSLRLQGRRSGTGEAMVEHVVDLPETSTAELQRFARSQRVTLNTVVQGAWALLLCRYSGERDVMFGSVVSGRRPEISRVEEIVGLFINILPARVFVEPRAELGGWLRSLQAAQMESMQFDYASPMQVSRWSDVLPGTRLYDTAVIFENFPTAFPAGGEPGTGDADTGAAAPIDFGQTDLPVTVMAVPGRSLRLSVRGDARLLDHDAVRRLATHLGALIDRFPSAGASPLAAISILDEPGRRRAIREWNDTATEGWDRVSVAAMFAEQVASTPDATALVGVDGSRTTFRDLDARSSRMADLLGERGVAAGDLVGVHLPRCVDAIAALLAIVKVGAAYLPLDPGYPAARLAHMVAESAAALVITDGWPAGDPALADLGRLAVLEIGASPNAAARRGPARPAPGTTPGDLAYVLFTSGSTGAPKGVAVEHRTVLNRLWWMWRAFPFEPCEVGVLRTSLNFVDSLWEILGPLMRGVPTVIAPDDVVADPAAFVDLAGAHGVTRLFLVPSYLDALLERVPDVAARAPALRTWFTGGEPLTAELCRRFRRLLPDARLYNIYGSSELWDVTVCDTGTDGIEHARVAVGHPIDNLRAYVLDLDGHPVSEGMTGTLHVAGAGLPRGYLDDTLTRQRFVHRRLDGDRPERLFDTGDLACYRTDGSIDVVGRRDQQLKLRGFRIEPDEIEAVLEQHPHVGEAAVALRPIGRGDERLVAYAVAAAQRGGDDHDDVAAYLATQLPPYMIPHRIVWLDAIPRTPSGKKDRRRLPVWPGGAGDDVAGSDGADGADRLSASRVGPDGDELGLETVLARAFTDVLGVGSVGRDDHFFADLGGHSLLAVRLCSRVATVLGIELPLSDVFDHPTVALLAARLRPALASAVDTKTLLDELEALDAEELEALLADLDETSSGAGDE